MDDPREIEALRFEVEQAVASLERVDRELASLEANLVNLGHYRRTIVRERTEILHRLEALRAAVPARRAVVAPPPDRRLPAPIWVQASEEQAVAFAAGKALRRLLGDTA